MDQNYDRDELWQFPADICFKVMAVNREGIDMEVAEVVNRHAPNDYSPSSQLSRNGNYVSLSFNIRVENKEQVDALYKDVFTVDGVKMTL
ncbi:YbeD family protein [Kangiella sp. TOML190]|uniref:YbeD family protein n=1 Tax=Kangiella sp. TOML190 TaxID=2931351 RepID=UPI002040B038|nr:DUF493 family protein [Kangiella sp. TOML190]